LQPALQQIKAQFGERMNELFEKMLAEEEALEQATDMLHDKEEEVRLLEWSNQRAEEQLSAAKEVVTLPSNAKVSYLWTKMYNSQLWSFFKHQLCKR
jgi:cell shape-determining protein MreC